MSSVMKNSATRDALLRRLSQLARRALFGTLSETYRTCGRPGCRCQQGQKHGPHLYVSFRGPSGTTTGYYVPQALAEAMRGGVAVWQELQALLRELAEVNRGRRESRGARGRRPRGGNMVRRRHGQRSIFEMLLPDGDKLWDPTLRRIDEVLQDEGMTDLVVEALGRRWRHSVGRGRPGTPAEVVLRMLVLKHLYDWSFEECEREVRASLIYRAFCRIGCEAVLDDTTLMRLNQALGPEVLKAMLERLVSLARQRKVVRGRKLRVDTTVVETNIHHPTDSTLLEDGVRVITRSLHKIRRGVGKLRFRDRTRSVSRPVFAIAVESRKLGEEGQAGLKKLYRQLMGTTRAVVRQAARAVGQAKRRAEPA